MSSISIPAEFTLHRKYTYDRTAAVKWIVSHVRPYLWIVVMLVVGAIGNAALAAYVPVLTGRAFNSMTQPIPDTSVLLPLALTMALIWKIKEVVLEGVFGAK